MYNTDIICRSRIHIEASEKLYNKKQANNKNNYNNEETYGCMTYPMEGFLRLLVWQWKLSFSKSVRVSVHSTNADIASLPSTESYFSIPMPHCFQLPLLSLSPAKLNFFQFQECAILLSTLGLITVLFPQSEIFCSSFKLM